MKAFLNLRSLASWSLILVFLLDKVTSFICKGSCRHINGLKKDSVRYFKMPRTFYLPPIYQSSRNQQPRTNVPSAYFRRGKEESFRELQPTDFLAASSDQRNRIVKTIAEKFLKRKAIHWLDVMAKQEDLIELTTFHAVLNCCRDKGSLEEFMKVFRTMQKYHQPDVKALNLLLGAQVKAGEAREAFLGLRQMGTFFGVEPDLYSFNTVLGAAARSGDQGLMDECLALMAKKGVAPDARALNARAGAAVRAGDPARALALLPPLPPLVALPAPGGGEGEEEEEEGGAAAAAGAAAGGEEGAAVRPNAVSYAIAINAYLELGDPISANRTIETMKAQGLNPTDDHYNNLLRYYLEKKQFQVAFTLFYDQMKKRDGVAPSSVTFNILLKGVYQRLTGMKLLAEMLQNRVCMDGATVVSLLKLMTHPADILTILDQCYTRSFPLNIQVLNTAISCLGRMGRPMAAARVFDSIVVADFEPDVASYNALLGAFGEQTETMADFSFQDYFLYNSSTWGNITSKPVYKSLKPKTKLEKWHRFLVNGPQSIADDRHQGVEAAARGQTGTAACVEVYRERLLLREGGGDGGGGGEEGRRRGRAPPRPDPRTVAIVLGALVRGAEAAGEEDGGPSRTAAAAAAPAYDVAAVCQAVHAGALAQGLRPEGRAYNALLRAYHDRVDESVAFWKETVRPSLQRQRAEGKLSEAEYKESLKAAYQGLLSNCGYAGRPDLALKVIYAQRADKLDPTAPGTLRPYRRALRRRRGGARPLGPLQAPYHSLLQVECDDYDSEGPAQGWKVRIRY